MNSHQYANHRKEESITSKLLENTLDNHSTDPIDLTESNLSLSDQ